ncbi:hypothetical protein GC176_06380 [bacterium]|nr:hypothetical protein [bacterium]
MAANHETDGGGRSDLDWLALLYVCGELSADEADCFESRLLAEPAVAEAVSRTVALGETVSLAFAVEADSADRKFDVQTTRVSELERRSVALARRSAVGRSVTVLTAGCVVVAALLISYRGIDSSPSNEDQQPLAANSEATRHSRTSDAISVTDRRTEISSLLLETWAEARESIAALDGETPSESIPGDSIESRTDSTNEVPDWLFVAVELSYDTALGAPDNPILEN